MLETMPCQRLLSGTLRSLLLFSLLLPFPLAAQEAQDILEEAMQRHEDRLADVEDVTIEQEVMGIGATTHMQKEMVEGSPVLRPVDVEAPGMDTGPMEDIGDLWADPRALYMGLNDRWTLEGEGEVDGRETWQLLLTEVDGVEWGHTPDGAGDLRPHRVELELDRDDLVPRVVSMDGDVEVDGETRPFSLRVELSDYRDVEGYLHPHLTTIETDVAAAGLSQEEVEEAQAAMDELLAELEELPEGQREMMEEALAPQMRMLDELLAGENIRLEVTVTDIRVNEGPPAGP